MIMTFEEALEITGTVECEFKADGEDECCECRKAIPKGGPVYYYRACYDVDEGDYYCTKCVTQWADDRAAEAKAIAEEYGVTV